MNLVKLSFKSNEPKHFCQCSAVSSIFDTSIKILFNVAKNAATQLYFLYLVVGLGRGELRFTSDIIQCIISAGMYSCTAFYLPLVYC